MAAPLAFCSGRKICSTGVVRRIVGLRRTSGRPRPPSTQCHAYSHHFLPAFQQTLVVHSSTTNTWTRKCLTDANTQESETTKRHIDRDIATNTKHLRTSQSSEETRLPHNNNNNLFYTRPTSIRGEVDASVPKAWAQLSAGWVYQGGRPWNHPS